MPTDPYAQLVGFPASLGVLDLTLLAAPLFVPILGDFAQVPFAVANPVSPYPQITVIPDAVGNPAKFQLNVTNAVFRVCWLIPVTAVAGTIALYQEVPTGAALGPATEVAYTATSAIVAVAGLTYFENSVLYRCPQAGTQISLRNTALVALVLPTLSALPLPLAPVPNFNVEMISLM
jgi:hypothetical protein